MIAALLLQRVSSTMEKSKCLYALPEMFHYVFENPKIFSNPCMISGFHCEADNNCTHLGYCTASSGNLCVITKNSTVLSTQNQILWNTWTELFKTHKTKDCPRKTETNRIPIFGSTQSLPI
jgi:hypothetical protein